MTNQNFFELAGYFANPIRNTRIEIEAKKSVIDNYNETYEKLTGESIPIRPDYVVILSNNADKWGMEMRLYFFCANTKSVPQLVNDQMTVNGRPGYENWNKRLNSIEIINNLFALGFRIGQPQNDELIKNRIPEEFLSDFQRGYDAL